MNRYSACIKPIPHSQHHPADVRWLVCRDWTHLQQQKQHPAQRWHPVCGCRQDETDSALQINTQTGARTNRFCILSQKWRQDISRHNMRGFPFSVSVTNQVLSLQLLYFNKKYKMCVSLWHIQLFFDTQHNKIGVCVLNLYSASSFPLQSEPTNLQALSYIVVLQIYFTLYIHVLCFSFIFQHVTLCLSSSHPSCPQA